MKILSINLFLIIFFIITSCSNENNSQQYSISTVVSPIEGGSIAPSSSTFENGQIITLTATPSDYYNFVNWDGDVTGFDNPITITVNSNKIVTAVFAKIDDDEDGVVNNLDNCPETQSGENVDFNGCSETQLIGETSLLFDKFWYTDSEYVYPNVKRIIYANGTTEGYVNDQLYYSGDWVWEDESLGIIKFYNIQGTNQQYSIFWQKYSNIDEHSHIVRHSINLIDYGSEVLWTDTNN